MSTKYYEMRRNAILDIGSMLGKKFSREDILSAIEQKYGFGERFVKKILEGRIYTKGGLHNEAPKNYPYRKTQKGNI